MLSSLGFFGVALLAAACWGALCVSGGAGEGAAAGRLRVYLGTYTDGKSQGIYLSELELASGALGAPRLAAPAKNPSFLALHPKGGFLYAVEETSTFGDVKSGSVSAFAVDRATGALTLLNRQSSRGTSPCHLVVDATGRYVLAANYSSGTVVVLPVAEDGRLGEAGTVIQHEGKGADPKRQKGPHAHSINLDAANHFAFAADLGLDRILVYRFDAAKGTLAPNDPPYATLAAGAGPRHFDFHPNGRFAYVINELNSTLTAFAYDAAAGKLTELQTLPTLPADFKGESSTAEVQVHPAGRFLYGSNRGHDSLACFAVDPETGRLTPRGWTPTGGSTPRHFAIEPGGRFLVAANQKTGNLAVFRIAPESGALTPAGPSVELGAPVCVAFANTEQP